MTIVRGLFGVRFRAMDVALLDERPLHLSTAYSYLRLLNYFAHGFGVCSAGSN